MGHAIPATAKFSLTYARTVFHLTNAVLTVRQTPLVAAVALNARNIYDHPPKPNRAANRVVAEADVKISIYDQTGPRIHTIEARPVVIDPRMKTCVHRTPFNGWTVNFWAVAEQTTGCRIGHHGKTRKQAIASAAEALKKATNEQIAKAMGRTLNHMSDLGEYIWLDGGKK